VTWRNRERSGRDRELGDECGRRCRRLPAWPTFLIWKQLPDRAVTQVSGHRGPAIEPWITVVCMFNCRCHYVETCLFGIDVTISHRWPGPLFPFGTIGNLEIDSRIDLDAVHVLATFCYEILIVTSYIYSVKKGIPAVQNPTLCHFGGQ